MLIFTMDQFERASRILQLLKSQYPSVVPFLDHKQAHELLFATILSAQNTDVGVNKATPALFKRYPQLVDYADSDLEELTSYIKTISFANNKAKYIQAAARKIIHDFSGKVPDTMQGLTSLPGVGRKTATVILFQWFGKNEGITVDTHVIRLAKWLRLSQHKKPEQIEQDLMTLFPMSEWGELSLRLIMLGREVLTAKNPQYKGTVWEEFVDIN